jgi:hypothetical protein
MVIKVTLTLAFQAIKKILYRESRLISLLMDYIPPCPDKLLV